MRTITTTLLAVALCACGNKSGDTPSAPATGSALPAAGSAAATASPATPTPTPAAAKTDPTAAVGVQAGGIQHDAKEGPAGVVSKTTGTVEVRRVGETKFAAAKPNDNLYPGDLVRTGDKSTATIALADHSVVEVAEVSTIGIASRDGTADPASAAAVLAGIARFTVTPRAPAEGPFRVYTPGGFVVTKGTTYGVGVAADGQTRVGVENGDVDVVGLANIDAAPVEVSSGNAASVDASGTVAPPAAWPTDDWGTWRDDADAKVDPGAAMDANGNAMATLDPQLTAGYADLDTTAKTEATFEANVAADADKDDVAAYQAADADGAANIDASFAVGGRIEALTWAYAAHAELANQIYIRHPDLEARWTPIAPRYDAAILWPKRYEVTATGYFEPLRMQYYVHEPRGRAHAELVGVAVPPFYAKVQPVMVDPVRVRAVVKGPMWIAPEVKFRVQPRPVWAVAPAPDWHARLVVAPAPMRAHVGWYVRPPAPRATVLVGAEVRGRWESHLDVRPPEPRAELRAHWAVPVGVRVKVSEPDFHVAERARATVKLDPVGHLVVRERAAVVAPVGEVRAGVAVGVHAPDVRGGVDVRVREQERGAAEKVNVQVHERGAAEKVNVQVHERSAAEKVNVQVHERGAAEKVNVQVHERPHADVHERVDVKVKTPEVKAHAEVKGGVKVH